MSHNRLTQETSPYLRQHATNPIWWWAWSEGAFAAARAQDKPIFLSIGYATCHWCHVMEGDSFHKQEVADLLNRSFIAIKVDREERPDVDAIYMTAVQAMTGSGGWPMSLALTPDGKPFWAATFVPRPQFMGVLGHISQLWQNSRAQILQSAADITQHLQTQITHKKTAAGTVSAGPEILSQFVSSLAQDFDPDYGGFGGAPKFPPSTSLLPLLHLCQDKSFAHVKPMIERTLDGMAKGGLYDHVGGGFCRYSTDDQWLVPHFEKMLYDNAMLAMIYSLAAQTLQNSHYERIARETYAYVEQDLRGAPGCFFSAEDADSEGAEGKFYLWPLSELEELLTPQELVWMKEHFSVCAEGHFHPPANVAALEKAAGLQEVQGNILHLHIDAPWSVVDAPVWHAVKAKLAERRRTRVRPLRDDKALTSWNGLMIASLAVAARTLDDQHYLVMAQQAADFIWHHLRTADGRLLHSYGAGQAKITGLLEDYAYLFWGLLELYETTQDAVWFGKAQELGNIILRDFADGEAAGFFDHDGQDQTLILQTKDMYDHALPATNALLGSVFWRLFMLSNETKFFSAYAALKDLYAPMVERFPRAFGTWMTALCAEATPYCFVVGSDTMSIKDSSRELQISAPQLRVIVPGTQDTVPAWREKNTALASQPVAFLLCTQGTCLPPMTSVQDVLLALHKNR